jgi:hypothetical protein
LPEQNADDADKAQRRAVASNANLESKTLTGGPLGQWNALSIF